ncbi:zinc-ribbon domain-containing protein [Chloroflexota bacterium]
MAAEEKVEKKQRCCPYCDEEISEASFPFCSACKGEDIACPQCHKPIPRDKHECPHCGAKIKD